jgi:hypothetical protein
VTSLPEPDTQPIATGWRVSARPAPAAPPGGLRYAGTWRRFWALVLDFIPGGIAFWIWLLMLGGTPWWVGRTSPAWLDCIDQPGDVAARACGSATEFNQAGVLALVALAFLSWMAYSVVMTSACRGTAGQLILGIRVSGPDGEAVAAGRALVRWLAFSMPWLALCLGYAIEFGAMACRYVDNGRTLCAPDYRSPTMDLAMIAIYVGFLGLAVTFFTVISDRAHRGVHDRLAGTVVTSRG